MTTFPQNAQLKVCSLLTRDKPQSKKNLPMHHSNVMCSSSWLFTQTSDDSNLHSCQHENTKTNTLGQTGKYMASGVNMESHYWTKD
jgi:hypothetical protein